MILTKKVNYKEVADFAIAHSNGHFGEIDRPAIMKTCEAFDNVGRLVTVRRDGKIVCAIYFDFKWHDTADVKELIIHKKYRNLKFLKSVILKALLMFPQTQFVRFNRRKHKDRASIYHISQFFKGEL